jgi:hypothetical protein
MSQVIGPVDPFLYPAQVHVRKHGPVYTNYESYRPWIEDEFLFRCVYCLTRKVWTWMAPLDLEHVVSQSSDPTMANDYDNLVLACRRCNALKGTGTVPDPCKIALGACIRIETDGTPTPLNKHGKRMIRNLRLDDPELVRCRKLLLDTVKLSFAQNRELYEQWMGFPPELHDLSSRRPPGGNTRELGVNDSCYARRLRGELPAVY